jgi:hypothetical protein
MRGWLERSGRIRTRLLSVVALNNLVCLAAVAQVPTQPSILPPSNLPANTPGSYQLIVPVVGQMENAWCWAASQQMVFEYDDPLPPVLQCQEANAAFGQSNCCTNPGSSTCDNGDGGPTSQYPFDSYSATPYPMTWDQLRYQIWVVNKPFAFGWNYTTAGTFHVMVVTGYSTDSAGNQSVWINNPEPVGMGDPCIMSYAEWAGPTTSGDSVCYGGPHTHEGDWFDFTYNGTRLIYNLATNSTPPTTGLTEAQAPNLAGTVVSDRMVPFHLGGPGFSISGSIQERVVRETASQTLDFYYSISNNAGSSGVINSLRVGDFAGFAVAAAYRPDSVGTISTVAANREISGNHIVIDMQQVIAAGQASHFILLMTNATTSNDKGTILIEGLDPQHPQFRGRAQLATDQPTG